MDVNEHHENMLSQFLRFTRYQRAQRIRSIEAAFEDVKNGQLQTDTTFTRDEVEDIFQNLYEVVKAEAESEFINATHTSVLLLKQMCHQAEEWHLKLNADVSQLENQSLLENIRAFEESQVKLQGSKPHVKLESIHNAAGATPLLKAEIDRLSRENQKLTKSLDSKEKTLDQEKAQLAGAQKEATLPNTKVDSAAEKEEIARLKKEMESLQARVAESALSSASGRADLEQKLLTAQQAYR